MPDLGAWRSSRAWLLTFCACIPTTIAWVKAVEKEALIELYNATNGASWARSQDAPYDEMMLPGGNKGWDFDGDPCPKSYNDSWHGVSCVDPCYYPIDGDDCRFGRITGLNLQFNGLEGTIPDSLFDKLINLTLIDMSHNSLSGTIPTTVGKLRNAMIFQMSHNSLSGTIPTEIRTMGSHVPPDEMAYSLADIEIPPEANSSANATYDFEITRTMGLTQLDLAFNNLNGTLPTTIGELANLQAADFSHNPELGADGCCEGKDSYYLSFYGYNSTLPTQIGMLKRLQVLRMDYSRFMRHLPTEVGEMRSLQYWRMTGTYETNQVSGSIPSQFGKLALLNEFAMQNNTLSGSLPSELGTMASLERFTIQDNGISGTIPDTVGDLTQLTHWDTFGNKMEGDLPSTIGKLINLEYFYLQNEHSDVIRNHFCQQRIEASAVGRKYNWNMVAAEYKNYKENSACANPYDVHQAFAALSGDI